MKTIILPIGGLMIGLAAVCQADRPNIILIMADDMGYSDLGCYGGEIDTPNLDRLAANGLRFTQFYNTARCCPTRAALLTGLHQHQAGVGHMTSDRGTPAYRGFLNNKCMTIAEVVRPAGYLTLCVGKWHVGSKRGQWPLDRGFDRFFGTPTGGGFYYEHAMRNRNRFLTLGNDVVDFENNGYITDMFSNHGIEFIEEAVAANKPFFLYLAHIAPHWPLQAPPKDVDKYRGRYDVGWDEIRAARYKKQRQMGLVPETCHVSPRDPQAKRWSDTPTGKRRDLTHRMAVYAAQIDRIDQNVGKLVARLEQLNQLDKTLIMFLSDNGCSAEGGPGGFRRGVPSDPIGSPKSYASAGLEWANVCDTPFRRFKMSTHEGGIATPMIAHWPDGIQQRGEFVREPGHVIDFMPTCAELAGTEYPIGDNQQLLPLQGRSLLPAFAGKSLDRDGLYWEHQGNRAFRDGNWKLVSKHGEPWELYELNADRTELNDLASSHPDIVNKMSQQWQAWADDVGVEPWPKKN